jgi:hypothetical protein
MEIGLQGLPKRRSLEAHPQGGMSFFFAGEIEIAQHSDEPIPSRNVRAAQPTELCNVFH